MAVLLGVPNPTPPPPGRREGEVWDHQTDAQLLFWWLVMAVGWIHPHVASTHGPGFLKHGSWVSRIKISEKEREREVETVLAF